MGIQALLNKAVKDGLAAHGSKSKSQKKNVTESAKSAKKESSTLKTKGVKSKKAKEGYRELYEQEPKMKKKKAKRVNLTPLVIDQVAPSSVSAGPKPKKTVKKSVVASKGGPKKKTSKSSQEGKKARVVEDTYKNPLEVYMPSPEEMDRIVAARAIQGTNEHGSFLRDPVEDAGLASTDFLKTCAEAKARECQTEDELLQKAHEYFSQLNRDENRRNALAMKRLKEMKRVNRAGGDKDGFKYVVPKNVSTVVRQIMAAEGVEGAAIEPESLESHFGGTGVKESESKPMRRKKVRNHAFDDFYQFQVAKKWTKNAESFLARGRASKNMFVAKQKQLRTIKNM